MQSVVEKSSAKPVKTWNSSFVDLSNLKQITMFPKIYVSILFLISKQLIYLLFDVELRLSLQTQLREASLYSHSCSS